MYMPLDSNQIQTPFESQEPLPDLEITELELQQRVLLQQVMQMSLEESNTKKLSRKNGLSEKNYRMIQSMKMSKSSQKCAICIEVFENGQLIKKLPCSHIFHRQCARQWLKVNKTCPVCRLNLQKHFTQLEEKDCCRKESIKLK